MSDRDIEVYTTATRHLLDDETWWLIGTTYDRPFEILLDKGDAAATVRRAPLHWSPPDNTEFEK